MAHQRARTLQARACLATAVPSLGSQTVPTVAEVLVVVRKPAENGGPCRGRTYGPLIKSQLLYQLS